MKITKKMRKREKGMNAITKANFEEGHRPPVYNDKGVKIQRGVPYVNPNNFQ